MTKVEHLTREDALMERNRLVREVHEREQEPGIPLWQRDKICCFHQAQRDYWSHLITEEVYRKYRRISDLDFLLGLTPLCECD